MNVLIYRDADSVGAGAAILVASHLLVDSRCVIGVDYHDSLLPVFDSLAVMTENGILNWNDAKVYQLYEFLPKEDGEQRIANLLGKALFAKSDISEKQYSVPFSTELNAQEVAETFERSILCDGGLDAALLAVRHDGALLMNATSECDPGVHVEMIDTDGFITAGAATIMQTKHPIIVAIGKNCAGAVRAMLTGSITETPLAMLRLHPGATFVLDEEAASLLNFDK